MVYYSSMSRPILTTKLYAPPPRPKAVPRPRLTELLNKGLYRKLTLISAPAGFGKTTLASEWVTGCGRAAAWLSLDELDNNPADFLAYLIAALQTTIENIGEEVLSELGAPQSPPIESLLARLLNEISAISGKLILVLDDYHTLQASAVDSAITFLLKHLPPQMHLVITTREEPHFPLAQLRARDLLTELHVTELRFTSSEAVEFLNQAMGLSLVEKEIAALERRTEGWVAGLQLAALALQRISVQGEQDTTNFIDSFTGSNHFVMDYLVEEVLQQQPESIQNFLMCTSVLNRFCGPLCDAVLRASSGSSQKILEYLTHANLLVIPLDDKRHWYRYHQLFADVLQARLQKEQPDQIGDLHRRACDWYEQNGFRADGIRHAFAAEDFGRAADLLDLDWVENKRNYFRNTAWFGWANALPDQFVRNRPRLNLSLAWEMLFLGELEVAEARMLDVERLLTQASESTGRSDGPLNRIGIENEEKTRALRGLLAIARAFHAQALGDVAGTVEHAHRGLAFVPETDHHTRGLASALLGLAHVAEGRLETAHTCMAQGMANLRLAHNLLFATSGTFVLANIRIAQGRLWDAIFTYEQSLQQVSVQGTPRLQGAADLHLGLSELYREQGNVEAATKHLLISEELGKPAALPEWPYPLYLVQARQKKARGDFAGALALLEQAEPLYQRGPVPNVRPVAALRAEVWIAQGKLPEVFAWARGQNLAADDELSYLREFEHITLARALVSPHGTGRLEGSIHTGLGLLVRLLEAAEAGGRNGRVIDILLLQALTHQRQGDILLALMALERALTLAEPEGYVRVFVDEGMPMAALLRAAVQEGIMADYAGKLLSAFGAEDGYRSGQQEALVEPLSGRELEILALIAAGNKNQEIADQLFISLNTVRYHTKNLYGKLGVNRRTQAVAKAQELALI